MLGERVSTFYMRKASADDLYAIADLEVRSAKHEQRLIPLQCTLEELYEIWYHRFLSGNYEILIAEVKNTRFSLSEERRLVGFIAFLAPYGKGGFIQAMYVDPAFFRKGIGAHLFAAAENILIRRGCPFVSLHVEPMNEAGQRFYARQGFVNQQRKVRHLYVLAKRLKSSVTDICTD